MLNILNDIAFLSRPKRIQLLQPMRLYSDQCHTYLPLTYLGTDAEYYTIEAGVASYIALK